MDTACEANLVLGLSCASTVEFEPLPPNWSAAEPSLTLGLFESANPKMETEERKPELGDKESCRAISDEVEEEGIARKKLRLTKEQSSLLEDSFREHSTLNPVGAIFFFKALLFLGRVYHGHGDFYKV